MLKVIRGVVSESHSISVLHIVRTSSHQDAISSLIAQQLSK